ncbi:nSTAND1 domain-containing NTPase [Nocardia altamirensis]|uniref:nSTAND1 domain-containing NTPase n=1 Tax=Nocardia altamirensis TaxID=472158 RepID=UPI000B2F87E7|nr:hypothetical protein [Nocardia altamirensis]
MTQQPPDRSSWRADDTTSGDGFSARFDALFTVVGNPPVKSVLRAANARVRPGARPITAQRISDWRRGNRVPATFDSVRPVLDVLISEGRRRAADDPRIDRSLLDPARWHAEWKAARAEPVVVDANRQPYCGLSAYRADDAELFFGRDKARFQLHQLVSAAEESGTTALVLLLGTRGVGKSSLLAAGLQADPGLRTPIRMTPNDDPVFTLHTALARTASAGRRLLLIDQGERLYTLCTREELRRQFLAELAALAAPDAQPPTTIVLAVDTAYLPELSQNSLLMTAVRNQSMVLEPMGDPELREAIVRPAASAGLRVEDSLIEILLQDLTILDSQNTVRLATLSYVLAATWENRRGRTLTLAAYRETGGVTGAFADRSELLWSGLSDFERQVVRYVMTALTIAGPAAVYSHPVPEIVLLEESEDPSYTEIVLARMIKDRIVVRRNADIELVHDLVLTAWPRMVGWLAEEKEFAPARQRIEADARHWVREDRPDTLLYTRTRLEDAAELIRRPGSTNRLTREFVAVSLVRHRKQVLRRRVILAAVVLLAVCLLVLTTVVITLQVAG